MSPELRVELEPTSDHAVVRLEGQLSARTAPEARRTILRLLLDLGRVVVDVTKLRLANIECVMLLPGVLAAAGGWPVARLAIVDSGGVFQSAAQRLHCADLLHFYPATEAGVRHVDDRPPRVRRDHEVGVDPSASGVARRFLLETASAWGLPPDLTEVAQLVVSELVSNAVEHAETTSTVGLELTDGRLKISVRDGSTIRPVSRPLDMVSFRGRGLPLIAQVSEDWGIVDHPDGKTVWAVLAVPDEDAEA